MPKVQMGQMNDFIVWNAGSLMMVRPLHEDATKHLLENTGDEAQWFGDSLAVEPRYIENLVEALRDAGFTVR